MGSLSLPVSTVPAENTTALSAMTWLSSEFSPTVQRRMMMQSLSFAPALMRAPEKTMQFSISPSMMQLSATRQLREEAFSP